MSNTVTHKFKVGDWVRCKDYVFKVASTNTLYDDMELEDGTWDSYNDEPNYYSEHACNLWEPRLGEWCWFKSASNTAEFGEYVGMTNIGRGKYQMRPTNSSCIFNYSYCEPFIGELPSFLKDTNDQQL